MKIGLGRRAVAIGVRRCPVGPGASRKAPRDTGRDRRTAESAGCPVGCPVAPTRTSHASGRGTSGARRKAATPYIRGAISHPLMDIPSPSPDASFKAWSDWSAQQLTVMLGLRVPLISPESTATTLGRMFHEARDSYVKWRLKTNAVPGHGDAMLDFIDAITGLASFTNLVLQLLAIRRLDTALYARYIKILSSRKARDAAYVTGQMFEIATAHSLLDKGLAFIQPEPPDFLLSHEGQPFTIECHAPRAGIGTSVRRKVAKAIQVKGSMLKKHPWRDAPAALFLDVTWLRRAEAGWVSEGDPLVETEQIMLGLEDAIPTSPFGLIVTFSFSQSVGSDGRPHVVTVRHAPVDIKHASLRSLFDLLFSDFEPAQPGHLMYGRMPT
jgi:hypothetical protein